MSDEGQGLKAGLEASGPSETGAFHAPPLLAGRPPGGPVSRPAVRRGAPFPSSAPGRAAPPASSLARAVTLRFSGAPSPSQRPEPQEPVALHASGQAGHEPALAAKKAKVYLGSRHQTRRHQ